MKHTVDSKSGLANDFVYTKAGTCITLRWRKMGWIPASEQPEIVEKWKYYQSLAARSFELPTSGVENVQELSA